MLFTKKFIELPGIGTCEVLSRGHWPDTIIVQTTMGSIIEIPWNTFYIQEVPTDEPDSH